MAEDSPPSPSRTSSSKPPPLRSLTHEESAQFRHRPPNNREEKENMSSQPLRTRRSSNFSDYSLKDARKSFQSSTDSLLLPRASVTGHDVKHGSSHWDSAPLAFALLPAVGGMIFQNGSSVVTDVMLLGIAAIFLNWSVRLPWDWYRSAQEVRKKEEFKEGILAHDSDSDEALSFSQTTLDEIPESSPPSPALPKPINTKKLPAHEAASNELYFHEILALLSCFIFPLLGAYLLHTIRTQLTRPSEGLVSNYNLTIFLLASEIRPMAHLVKLIQARTLHLQRIVNSNPYITPSTTSPIPSSEIAALVTRLEALESQTSPTLNKSTSDIALLSAKQSSLLLTEVRKSLQPELEALNRAVRRYEKRATLQAFQTDSRLHDLDSRLNDAISLAANAANQVKYSRGFTRVVVEWMATGVVLPVQAVGWVASLPFKGSVGLLNIGKGLLNIGRGLVGGKRVVVEEQVERDRERERRRINGKMNGNGKLNGSGKSLKKIAV